MRPYTDQQLWDFVVESNRIEGILRDPRCDEIAAHVEFLSLAEVTVADVSQFVWQVANAPIRKCRGMDVMIGSHRPPRGGKEVPAELAIILSLAMDREISHPYSTHRKYETLHPFMDGNGRSGRALWAWQMLHHDYWPGLKLGFLHAYYYQSLEASR